MSAQPITQPETPLSSPMPLTTNEAQFSESPLTPDVVQLKERRRRKRTALRAPASVRYLSAAKRDLRESEHDALLDNLSSNGLFITMTQDVEPGQKLSIVFPLIVTRTESATNASEAPSEAATKSESPTCIAVTGVVRRLEDRPGLGRGVAIEITHYRFLYGDGSCD